MGDSAVIDLVSYKVKGTTKIWAGSQVAINSSGYLVPASAAATQIVVGRAEETVDNLLGADGAVECEVRRGTFSWANAGGGEALAATDVEKVCYAVDDQTVGKTNAGGTLSVAGIVKRVETGKVWVETTSVVAVNSASTQTAFVDITDSTGLSGSHDDTLAATPPLTAPSAYTAHSSGATPVTSAAATDLDTTAAAVANVRLRLADTITQLAITNQNISDLAQKVKEIRTALIAAGIIA